MVVKKLTKKIHYGGSGPWNSYVNKITRTPEEIKQKRLDEMNKKSENSRLEEIERKKEAEEQRILNKLIKNEEKRQKKQEQEVRRLEYEAAPPIDYNNLASIMNTNEYMERLKKKEKRELKNQKTILRKPTELPKPLFTNLPNEPLPTSTVRQTSNNIENAHKRAELAKLEKEFKELRRNSRKSHVINKWSQQPPNPRQRSNTGAPLKSNTAKSIRKSNVIETWSKGKPRYKRSKNGAPLTKKQVKFRNSVNGKSISNILIFTNNENIPESEPAQATQSSETINFEKTAGPRAPQQGIFSFGGYRSKNLHSHSKSKSKKKLSHSHSKSKSKSKSK